MPDKIYNLQTNPDLGLGDSKTLKQLRMLNWKLNHLTIELLSQSANSLTNKNVF
jgi:uncharacterized protein YaaR (DUF327 family)